MMGGAENARMLTNIVFTRNRPLQLHAYLASRDRHLPTARIETVVLYKVEKFAGEYEQVFAMFPDIRVVRETNFHDDLLRVIGGIGTDYIMFATDDVVYYDGVNLDLVARTFEASGRNIFGFSLRLDPGRITDTPEERTIAGEQVFSVDWRIAADKAARYPFELNSTVYKTDLVRRIVAGISSERPLLKKLFAADSLRVRLLRKLFSMKDFLAALETFRKPNSLEGYGYRWCRRNKAALPGRLFFQKACASAIQVNIVNTETDNPIFGGSEHTVEALNERFKAGYRFDHSLIERQKPRLTHLGAESFAVRHMQSPESDK